MLAAADDSSIGDEPRTRAVLPEAALPLPIHARRMQAVAVMNVTVVVLTQGMSDEDITALTTAINAMLNNATIFQATFGYPLAAVLMSPTAMDDYVAPPLELGAPDEGNGGLVGGILGPLGALFGLAGLYCWYRSKSAGEDRTKLVTPKQSTPSVKDFKVGTGAELTEYKGGSLGKPGYGADGGLRGSVHEMAANI